MPIDGMEVPQFPVNLLRLPSAVHSDGGSLHSARTLEACRGTTLFEEVQRSHFRAFFVEEHCVRHALPPDANLPTITQILVHGLHKMISSGPWLRLQLHLKVRRTLRKRARHALQQRAQRAETLNGWFKFWCAAEAKIQQSFRQQLQSPVTL
eukprot:EG_transcript_41742